MYVFSCPCSICLAGNQSTVNSSNTEHTGLSNLYNTLLVAKTYESDSLVHIMPSHHMLCFWVVFIICLRICFSAKKNEKVLSSS